MFIVIYQTFENVDPVVCVVCINSLQMVLVKKKHNFFLSFLEYDVILHDRQILFSHADALEVPVIIFSLFMTTTH